MNGPSPVTDRLAVRALAAAPRPTPRNHAKKTTPAQSSLPRKTTRNSRKKTTWTVIAQKPRTNTAARLGNRDTGLAPPGRDAGRAAARACVYPQV